MRTALNILLFFAALVVVVACLQFLLGGGGGEEREQRVDWSAVEPRSGETVRLRWLGPPFFPSAREGTWIERNLEAALDLELEPVILDMNSYLRRKPMMMAGGDVPDVIWESSPTILQADAYHGFLLEVPVEVIREHAPRYVEKLERLAPDAWLLSHYEGRNYGVPLYAIAGQYPRPGLWRKDWLEAVGMEVPDTLEELREAMRRFRYGDPDGNGMQDTYGTTPSISGSLFFARLFGLHEVDPYGWKREGERLVWGGILPETRHVLGIVREMYAEGVIDPDFLAIPEGSRVNIVRQKLESGQIGYLDIFGAWMQVNPHLQDSLSIVYTIKKLNPDAELAPGEPLRKNGRVSKVPVSGSSTTVLAFGRHLKDEPHKVVRALRMLDRLASDTQLHAQSMIGKRGTHWEYDPRAGVQFIGKYREERKSHFLTRLDERTAFFAPFSLDEEEIEPYLAEGELEYLETRQSPEYALFSPLPGGSAVVPGLSELMAEPQALQEKVFAEIVLGERPLEDFDWFVEEWKRLGGAEATEKVNAYYEQADDLLERLGVVVDG